MSKIRRPRQALGMLERADGVRVEVKQSTVWKHLMEQQQAIQQQQHLIASLQAAIAKIESERNQYRAAFGDVADAWWVRLGCRLGLVRLRDVRGVEVARPALGRLGVPSVSAQGDTETVSLVEPAAAS